MRAGSSNLQEDTTYAGATFDSLLDERLNTDQSVLPEGVNRAARMGTAAAYGFFFIDRTPATDSTPETNVIRVTSPRKLPGISVSSSRWNELNAGVRQGADLRTRTGTPALAGAAPQTARPTSVTASVFNPTSRQRSLSDRQRAALGELVALGARLDDDFTAVELRSAFRTLARRFHPDRHTASSEGDRTRLAMLFGRVYDAYQVLAGAIR